MRRDTALRLVTGHRDPITQLTECVTLCAERLEVSRSWVYRWPDELPRPVCDRVLAYLVRVEAKVQTARGERLPPMHRDACALNHPDDLRLSAKATRPQPRRGPRRNGSRVVRPRSPKTAANEATLQAA